LRSSPSISISVSFMTSFSPFSRGSTWLSPCVPALFALGAGRMLGRQDVRAEAALEPALEPESAPEAGSTSLEHCCRGGRSSGYLLGGRQPPPIFF
jgi:hypothetical protein